MGVSNDEWLRMKKRAAEENAAPQTLRASDQRSETCGCRVFRPSNPHDGKANWTEPGSDWIARFEPCPLHDPANVATLERELEDRKLAFTDLEAAFDEQVANVAALVVAARDAGLLLAYLTANVLTEQRIENEDVNGCRGRLRAALEPWEGK